MKETDILEKQGFGEARKDGGHNLYVRARLTCSVGDHIVQKDYTLDEWDNEIRNPEPWKCPDHATDYDRVFGSGAQNFDLRCSQCGTLVNMSGPKSKPIPDNFVCKECQAQTV